MTHISQMADSDGEFGQWNRCSEPCPKCGSQEYFWCIWESRDGAYEDEKRKCTDCNFVMWIDGIDS